MATIPSGRGDLPFAPPPLQTYSYPGLNVNDSQSSRIIGTCVTLIVISTIVVALRFVARHLSRAGLWWDDWTILAALITSYGANICTLAGIPIGFGRHVGSFGGLLQRINVASSFFKLFYAYEIIYGFSIALAKISILLFYSRIFKDRLFRWALWITYGLVGCFTFAVEVAIWAQCQPTRAFWDLSIQPRNCVDLRSFFIGSGVPNIILNFIILVLPLPMVWTLEIERKHKLALSGVFLLGGLYVLQPEAVPVHARKRLERLLTLGLALSLCQSFALPSLLERTSWTSRGCLWMAPSGPPSSQPSPLYRRVCPSCALCGFGTARKARLAEAREKASMPLARHLLIYKLARARYGLTRNHGVSKPPQDRIR